MKDKKVTDGVWSPRADEWKEIDLTIGDGGIKSINEDRLVKIEGSLEPGSKLKIIRNEEIWATDPETGECYLMLHRHSYIREANGEEEDYLKQKLFTEGVLQSVLSMHFN